MQRSSRGVQALWGTWRSAAPGPSTVVPLTRFVASSSKVGRDAPASAKQRKGVSRDPTSTDHVFTPSSTSKERTEQDRSEHAFFTPQHDTQRTFLSQHNVADDLLSLCDPAIKLSRDAPSDVSFGQIRCNLKKATLIYLDILQSIHAQHTNDMYYETYLVRGSYIQVIRSIGALAGPLHALSCAEMMVDYLDWEYELYARGIKSPDGTQDPVTEAMDSVKRREKARHEHKEVADALFFKAPYPQDFMPTLFDLFSDLTAAKWTVSGHKISDSHAIPPRKAIEMATLLWKKASQLPPSTWSKPMTPELVRFRSRTPQFASAAHIFQSCSQMLVRKMLVESELVAAVHHWRDAIKYWQGTAHLGKASTQIAKALRRSLRHLVLNNSPKHGAPVSDVIEYLKAVNLMVEDIRNGGQRVERHGWIRMISPADIDTILRCAVKSLASSFPRADAQEDAKQLQANIHSHLLHWLESMPLANDCEARLSPENRMKISTCQLLLDSLMLGTLLTKKWEQYSLKLLDNLSRNPTFPELDNKTLTKVFSASADRHSIPLMYGALVIANDRAVPLERGQEWEDEQALHSSPLLIALHDALSRKDIHRLCSLIRVLSTVTKLTRTYSHPTNNTDQVNVGARLSALSRYMNTSVRQMTYFLYPSLDRRATMGKRRPRPSWRAPLPVDLSHRERRRAYGRALGDPPHDPQTYLSVLQLLHQSGMTSLAERVWRMMQRTSVRRNTVYKVEKREARRCGVTPDLSGWKIPIQGYTLMMRLYAKEVRRAMGTGLRHLRPRSARTHREYTQLRSRSGTPTSVVDLARQKAMHRYEELQGYWELPFTRSALDMSGIPQEKRSQYTFAEDEARSRFIPIPDARFFQAFFAVFRVGAKQYAKLDRTHLSRGQVELLKLAFQDMKGFGLSLESDMSELPS